MASLCQGRVAVGVQSVDGARLARWHVGHQAAKVHDLELWAPHGSLDATLLDADGGSGTVHLTF